MQKQSTLWSCGSVFRSRSSMPLSGADGLEQRSRIRKSGSLRLDQTDAHRLVLALRSEQQKIAHGAELKLLFG